MTGKKTAMILPSVLVALNDIQTAMQTRKLQRMPLRMASKKVKSVLAVAVAMTVSET